MVYPSIYEVLYIPGGAGFQPSTAAKHLNHQTMESKTMDLNQDLANWKFARWAESICILSPAEQDGSRDVTWHCVFFTFAPCIISISPSWILRSAKLRAKWTSTRLWTRPGTTCKIERSSWSTFVWGQTSWNHEWVHFQKSWNNLRNDWHSSWLRDRRTIFSLPNKAI